MSQQYQTQTSRWGQKGTVTYLWDQTWTPQGKILSMSCDYCRIINEQGEIEVPLKKVTVDMLVEALKKDGIEGSHQVTTPGQIPLYTLTINKASLERAVEKTGLTALPTPAVVTFSAAPKVITTDVNAQGTLGAAISANKAI